MKPFHETYKDLLSHLIDSDIEHNKRTGVNIKVSDTPISFNIDLSNGVLPTIGVRKTFPRSAAAEMAWFVQGEQDISFIKRYAPMWDKFSETIKKDDSEIEGVLAAYGYRWRHHFGRDQLNDAIKALEKDPSNRRIYISAWDASNDGLLEEGQSNVPCPVGFTLSIVKGRLNSVLTLRSSDVFVGLPYDVMGHALLMDSIAKTLKVDLGIMHTTLAHPHLYQFHWEMTRNCIKNDPIIPDLQMPHWSLSEIEKNPTEYVEKVRFDSMNVTWPTYNPKPFIVDKKDEEQQKELEKITNNVINIDKNQKEENLKKEKQNKRKSSKLKA